MEHDNDTKQHTDLIASNRVEGTAVYDRSGNKLGTISHFMVSKRQGSVAYAVLSFGSFLGMGGEEYTLPWDKLEYDKAQGGYVVDMTEEQLKGAPRYEQDRSDDYDRTYYEGVSGYYGTNRPTW
jgi:sporulation protein YlmC with PRC-barrel domain